ncbi:MAG: hypothetical protein KBG16_08575 [Methanospirillum sp.]|nr:hypothetical protein [Methanospirillum sp.]HOW04818.1 hypothetical protein [Methanospirillum hungatei]
MIHRSLPDPATYEDGQGFVISRLTPTRHSPPKRPAVFHITSFVRVSDVRGSWN